MFNSLYETFKKATIADSPNETTYSEEKDDSPNETADSMNEYKAEIARLETELSYTQKELNKYLEGRMIKGVSFYIKKKVKTLPVSNYSGSIRDLKIITANQSIPIPENPELTENSAVEIYGAYDVWLYNDNKCVYIHKGETAVSEIFDIKSFDSLKKVKSVIVRPAAIIDNESFAIQDYDMGKLKDYMGKVVSFVSFGNQNFALNYVKGRKSNTTYDIQTFTANNTDQQFKVNSRGQLMRINTSSYLYHEGGALKERESPESTDRKSLWCMDDKNRLIPASDPNKAIDIKGATYRKGINVIIYPKHDGKNQKWKVVSVEGFSSLFVGSYNSTLNLIKLIFGLLIVFCFFKLMMAAKYDAIQRRRRMYKNNV